jgi:hypothetical protein
VAEDRRVALAAVVVTGVIGVSGPLITWAATRDAQEASARAELVRAERADARAVLDRAAITLERAIREAQRAARVWDTGHVVDHFDTRFGRSVNALLHDAQRLRIRLGRHPAVTHYINAGTLLTDIRGLFEKKRTTQRELMHERKFEKLTLADEAFIIAANDLARSRLTVDEIDVRNARSSAPGGLGTGCRLPPACLP